MKLTEYLAIYGATLSTIVFLWNAFKSAPRLKVTLIFDIKDDNDDWSHGVSINIRNPSSRVVHLSAVAILYPSDESGLWNTFKHLARFRNYSKSVGWVHDIPSHYGIDHGCPTSLEPGSSYEVFLPIKVVEKVLKHSKKRKLMVVVQDQLWNNHYSNQYKVNEEIKEAQQVGDGDAEEAV